MVNQLLGHSATFGYWNLFTDNNNNKNMDVAESKNSPMMFSALLYEQKAQEVTWERNLILLLSKFSTKVGHHVFKNFHSVR